MIKTSKLNNRFIKNLLDTFAYFRDYQFILKIDEEEKSSLHKFAENISNIYITHWAPQIDLLAHPRIKLFITHGGYNSLLEAALNGVPVLTMGIFADQFRNGHVAERNGWGISFEKLKLLEDGKEFRTSILKILSEPSFKENAVRIANILKTKPFSAKDRLTKSIRFLEENGGKFPELQPDSLNLGFFVFYNIDIIATLLLSSVFVTIVILAMLKLTFKAANMLRNVAKAKHE